MALIGTKQAGLAKFAAPGHWNDPDMLEVGNGKLTMDENRFHMTLWAMLAAPLLAGNNLTLMSPEVGAILMNKRVIAIDQDPAGHQAERVLAEGPIEIWSRPLADGSVAVAILQYGRKRERSARDTLAFRPVGVYATATGFRRLARQGAGNAGVGFCSEAGETLCAAVGAAALADGRRRSALFQVSSWERAGAFRPLKRKENRRPSGLGSRLHPQTAPRLKPFLVYRYFRRLKAPAPSALRANDAVSSHAASSPDARSAVLCRGCDTGYFFCA